MDKKHNGCPDLRKGPTALYYARLLLADAHDTAAVHVGLCRQQGEPPDTMSWCANLALKVPAFKGGAAEERKSWL